MEELREEWKKRKKNYYIEGQKEENMKEREERMKEKEEEELQKVRDIGKRIITRKKENRKERNVKKDGRVKLKDSIECKNTE